ncbi:MAG: hypothetical protein QG630_545, partial [Patescibacteria group bacterium]|nr:hypothetical protein [Patescibacteria group bacterium]
QVDIDMPKKDIINASFIFLFIKISITKRMFLSKVEFNKLNTLI